MTREHNVMQRVSCAANLQVPFYATIGGRQDGPVVPYHPAASSKEDPEQILSRLPVLWRPRLPSVARPPLVAVPPPWSITLAETSPLLPPVRLTPIAASPPLSLTEYVSELK